MRAAQPGLLEPECCEKGICNRRKNLSSGGSPSRVRRSSAMEAARAGGQLKWGDEDIHIGASPVESHSLSRMRKA